jgi:nitrogen fixation protein FixH
VISPARLWSLAPAALLVLCLGGQAVLVRATRGLPGLTVDEGYDERARRFDALSAEARKAEALGWRLDVAGEGALEVRVTDGAGHPVTGARARALPLSLSGGGSRDALALDEVRPGVYGAALPGPGRWELHLVVERDAARLERTVLRVAP